LIDPPMQTELTSDVSKAAREYTQAGFKLIPIPKGKKGPTHKNWNAIGNCIADPDTAAEIDGNVGLAHAYSGTCVIDVDDLGTAAAWLDRHGIDLAELMGADDAVMISSGRANRGKLLYRLPPGVDPLPSRSPKDSGLELRCATGAGLTVQDVLPPSIHPDTGRPYSWVTGIVGHWSCPPVLPDSLLALWRAQLAPAAGEAPAAKPLGVTPERLRGILSRLDPDAEYNEWAKVGAALHHESGGAPWGLDIWDEWSATGLKYKSREDLIPHWRSWGKYAGRPVTAQWLISQAGGVQPDDFDDLTKGSEQTEWPECPEPQPLGPDLPPVPAFDPNLLPTKLRPWIMDISDRMQAPPDFPAASAVVAAGGLIGRRIGIAPQERTDWVEVPNLWGGIVGRPSVMKSPTMSAAFAPVRRLESNAAMHHAEAMRLHAAAMEEHDLKKKAARDFAKTAFKKALEAGNEDPATPDFGILEPDTPTRKRYILEDTSYEKAGEIMAENPGGITVLSDELVGFLRPLTRPEKAEARGFWLKAWNGVDWYPFDRIGRGSILTPCTASVFGGVQPAKLAAFLKEATTGGEGDDGLLQRFQVLVYPDVSPDWQDRDQFPDKHARTSYTESLERLAAIDPGSVGALGDDSNPIPVLRFCPEALRLFRDWRQSHEQTLRMGDLHPALESHFAKYRTLVPCLALIFHLVDCPDGGPVSVDATIRALAWSEYLAAHAVRIYGSVTLSERTNARQIWRRLKKVGDLPQVFTVRDIQRKGWAGLGDVAGIRDALRVLEDHGLIQRREISWALTGGRPAENYRVNPRAEGLP
jgi:hypothetical protein